MKPELRSVYVEYIAAGLRYASEQTGKQWPGSTVVVTKTYSKLAEVDDIMGMDVLVMDMPSSYEFFVAFRSCFESDYKLQTAFLEYMELYPFEAKE